MSAWVNEVVRGTEVPEGKDSTTSKGRAPQRYIIANSVRASGSLEVSCSGSELTSGKTNIKCGGKLTDYSAGGKQQTQTPP